MAKLVNSILMLIVGMVFGIGFVLSCGDDSPRRVDAGDAGACNCPPAEAPIASRIMVVERPFVIPANTTQQSEGVACPFNSVVLSGGCAAAAGAEPNIILEQDIPGANGWGCSFRNLSNADVSVRAIVRCLVAAQ